MSLTKRETCHIRDNVSTGEVPKNDTKTRKKKPKKACKRLGVMKRNQIAKLKNAVKKKCKVFKVVRKNTQNRVTRSSVPPEHENVGNFPFKDGRRYRKDDG
ncbi:Hypothetical protein CINCED_3A012528 [Cinara cedri]|uniref:Uncharacterized protein n=1 Tax=Cinara cedri TaxID=506608 RepID=A0A5E4MBN3_9HEMI|nr:Hypothetical protein CINCED_3A012528 [Cinara cedri]